MADTRLDPDVAPRVSVVMVAYNSATVIGETLGALQGTANLEVVVVDNASDDNTIDLVRKEFPDVVLVERDTNGGFAVAVNDGVAASRGLYLLLLNPDAHIDPTNVHTCIRALEADSSIGVLAPHLRQPQGRLDVMEAGRAPTLWRMFSHYSGISRLSKGRGWLEGQYLLVGTVSTSRQVDWVSGACMFVRRTLWDQLGGLSERWFMYAEDIDFCLRANKTGARTVLLMDAHGTHQMGGSSIVTNSLPEPPVSSAWLLNLYDMYKLHYNPAPATSWMWRKVAWAGMRSRASLYSIRSRRIGSEGEMWRAESSKFKQHAQAIRQIGTGPRT